MAWNDDKDDEPLSTRRSLERADHRKKERQEELNRKKMDQNKLQKLKREMLQKQMPGSVILRKDSSVPQTFGPKTVEEKAGEQYEAKAEQGITEEELIDAEEAAVRDQKESKKEKRGGSPD